MTPDAGLTLYSWLQEAAPLVAFLMPGGSPSTTLPVPGSLYRYTPAIRQLLRLHPVVRYISIAKDVYDWYNTPGQSAPDGYTLIRQQDCCTPAQANYCGDTKFRYRGVNGSFCAQVLWNITGGDGNPCTDGAHVEHIRQRNAGNVFAKSIAYWTRNPGSTECFDPSQLEDQTKARAAPELRPPYDPRVIPDGLRPPTQPRHLPETFPPGQPRPRPPTEPFPDVPFTDPGVPDIDRPPVPWIDPDIVPLPRPPVVDPDPDPDVDPRPRPPVDPDPRPPTPDPDPDVDVDPRPDTDPEPEPFWEFPPPELYVPAPPGPRTRERKVVRNTRLGPLERGFSGFTEATEFVDCLHKALPKDKRAKAKRYREGGREKFARVSFKRKLAAVYENIQHVDVAKALECHALNQLEDIVIGKLSREVGRGARHTGRQFGLGIGGPFNWRL